MRQHHFTLILTFMFTYRQRFSESHTMCENTSCSIFFPQSVHWFHCTVPHELDSWNKYKNLKIFHYTATWWYSLIGVCESLLVTAYDSTLLFILKTVTSCMTDIPLPSTWCGLSFRMSLGCTSISVFPFLSLSSTSFVVIVDFIGEFSSTSVTWLYCNRQR